jgi:ABC-2 type transport system ATP-binding protein
MISVNQLKKEYNGILVLNIPSLTIPKNQSFGLVGNNGAGKTTFFRLILDLIEAADGEILLDGQPVVRNDDWKFKVGSFLDEGFLIDFLTAEEYFNFVAKLHNISKDDLAIFLQTMEDFFNGEILGTNKLVRDFSKGNQKKIGIVAALIGNPSYLILDEPFTGLDPSTQIRLKRFLNDLQENRDITMLISSHDLNHITEVCHRIVILEKGNIVNDIETNESTLEELQSYFAV